jgi:TolB-like protein/DNA-binding winged helix-turn-helix (wHTH) protein
LDSAVHALGEIYQAGDLCIDVGRHRVAREGSEIPLPNLSFELLLALAKAHPRMLTTEELLESVWAPAVVNPETVGQRVKLLRQALGDNPRAPRYVVGVRGLGYRMDVPVARAERDRKPHGATEANDATIAQASAVTGAARGLERGSPDSISVSAEPRASTVSSIAAVPDALRARARLAYWVGGAAVALLLGASLAWLLIHRQPTARVAEQIASQSLTMPGGAPAPRGPRKVRLAILPFENLSPEPADAFFTDGLYEEIISTLAEQLPGVEVISRTTMTSERLKSQPVGFVASAFGATHVIEGSVRREGTHVRVTLQLIDAGTDQHVWSKSYDRTLESALTLQSEVAGELASQLSLQLPASTPSKGLPTRDADAYDEYLKAVVALSVGMHAGPPGPELLRDVERMLTQAIGRDPGFALAYAQRARVATYAYQLYGSDPQHIRDDVARAKSLGPREPVVLGAEGLYLVNMEENERALTSLNAAETLGLTDPEWLIPKTLLLLRMGRVDDAVRTQQHMMELDPANPRVILTAGGNLTLLRRPAEVLRVIQLLKAQFPDVYFWNRAWTLFDFTGRTQELRQAFDRSHGGQTLAQIAANPGALSMSFEVLRFEHRYRELDQLLQLMPPGLVPYAPSYLEFYEIHTDNVPAALYRGWSALLLGDEARAAREGQSLLAFVKTQNVSPRVTFFFRRLEAEGHVFAHQPAAAIEAASASLELMPRDKDAMTWIGVALAAARVYAWAGARERAVTLLEQLATVSPGAPPAFITRDPLIAVPLAPDSQYQALAGRLEAQMAALSLN